MIRRQIIYRGTVQGVGFRWTTMQVARRFEVAGYVRNCPDGSVELVAEGEAAEVEAFALAVRQRMAGYVRDAQVSDARATGEYDGFDVRH